jgi:hypothetical protein
MNYLPRWRWLAFFFLLCGTTQAGEPLLVVVEPAPGASVTPDEVRAAVASETQEAVAAALNADIDANSEALIVAVDAHRALLTFRPRQGDARRRQIDLPVGHHDQLKTIGWIALNLVRDQVQGLVGVGRPDSTGTSAPASASPSTPLAQDQSPSNLDPPPATPQQPKSAMEPPAVQSAKMEEASKPISPWSASMFAGPSMFPFDFGWRWSHYRPGNEWQLEVQRSYQDWTLGVALDLGAIDMPVAGLAGFVSDGWRWHTLRLDGAAGIGLELTTRITTESQLTNNSQTGMLATSTIRTGLRPSVYGRTNATVVWQVRPSVALMLRLGFHLETESVAYCYGSALLGLRVNLP